MGAEDPKFLTLFELCDRLFQKEYARALVDLKKWLRPSKALAREQVKDLSLLFEVSQCISMGLCSLTSLRLGTYISTDVCVCAYLILMQLSS